MDFCSKIKVHFPNWTQLFELHKIYLHNSNSEDLFCSCFMLLGKPVELTSRRLTEEDCFGHSMANVVCGAQCSSIMVFGRASGKRIEDLPQRIFILFKVLILCGSFFSTI